MTTETRGPSDSRKGPQAEECEQPLEVEKAKETNSHLLLKSPEATSPADFLILDFWPPDQGKGQYQPIPDLVTRAQNGSPPTPTSAVLPAAPSRALLLLKRVSGHHLFLAVVPVGLNNSWNLGGSLSRH